MSISFVVVSVLAMLLNRYNGEVIDGSVIETVVECGDTDDCNVRCYGDYACQGKSINCPSDSYSCFVDCNGESSCHDTAIYCPASNGNCNVACKEKNSCNSANILWSSNVGVNNSLTCDGLNSCLNVNLPPINAINNNEEFRLNCTSHNECAGKTINCPSNAPCHVMCFGKDSCIGTDFNWPSDGNIAHSLHWTPVEKRHPKKEL